MICRHCKTTENLMPKPTAVLRMKSGKVHSYYSCRECNRKRLRAYRSTVRGAERTSLAMKKSVAKYPERHKARLEVRNAVRNGVLVKPFFCERCPSITDVEAHHDDYSKPLGVVWLCRNCHSNVHMKKHKKDVIMALAL